MEGGEAHVVESYARAPFHYLPVSRRDGGLPVLTLVNSSGGVLGGDALEVTVALLPGRADSVRRQRLHADDSSHARTRSRPPARRDRRGGPARARRTLRVLAF